MSGIWDLNLIHFFDFYLATTFLLSTANRVRQYSAVLALVLRTVTFGFVNPRQLVAVEVRTALIDASKVLNTNLWWVVLQAALRVSYGLSLWVTYAATTA